jgi:hypothetical protein
MAKSEVANEIVPFIPPLKEDEPTPEQKAAIDKILEALETKKRACLSGPAGSGKSFCVKRIISKYPETIITATTNKAALNLSKSTDKDGFTIHSWLYLRPNINYRTGETDLEQMKEWEVGCKLLVVDECSLVSTELLSYITRYCVQFGCAVLYIGDECQLPPVGDTSVSATFVGGARLSTIMRFSSPIILQWTTQLRDAILNKKQLPADIRFGRNPDGFVHTTSRAPEWKEFAGYDFLTDTIVTYTNEAVNDYNAIIRKQRGFRANSWQEGDLVTLFKPYQGVPVNEIYVVESVERSSTIVPVCGQPRVYDVWIIQPHNFMVPMSQGKVSAAMAELRSRKMWHELDTFGRRWADLHYAYAFTAHRAQGSQWKTVWVDLTAFLACSDMLRAIYVAISRATSGIHVLCSQDIYMDDD